MHELTLTRNIVSVVAKKAEGRAVRRVHLHVGALAGVEVASIRFCFDLCAKGTTVEGAELVVHQIPGRGHCDGCDMEITLTQLLAVCPCEHRAPVQILAGEELLIKSMEV